MAESVTVFVGMTKKDFLREKLGVTKIFDEYMKDKKVAFRAEKIFLHPKLQTKKV